MMLRTGGRKGSGLLKTNQPQPARVLTDQRQRPTLIDAVRVERVQDWWRVDDTWWREPLLRIYYECAMANGDLVTVFHDRTADRWFRQRYHEPPREPYIPHWERPAAPAPAESSIAPAPPAPSAVRPRQTLDIRREAENEEIPVPWQEREPHSLVMELTGGWELLALPSGKPRLRGPDGELSEIPLGVPPPDPRWLRIVGDLLDAHDRPASRVRAPRHIAEAARLARGRWTSEWREVIVQHRCGHFASHIMREADLDARMPAYAAEECPGCDPEGFWNE